MMSELLIHTSDQIGLKLIGQENDVLVGQNGHFYVTHTKLRSMMELQSKHGTGRVHYSPNPLLLLEPDVAVERRDVILIISSQLRQDVETSIKKHFDDPITIIQESKLISSPSKMLIYFRNVKLVIADQVYSTELFMFLLGAAVPFVALEGDPGAVKFLLKSMGLEYFMVQQNGDGVYRGLNRCIEYIKNRYVTISNTLTNGVNKFRRIMSIVPSAQGFRDVSYDNATCNSSPPDGIPAVAISPGDYAHIPGLELLSREFSHYQCRGGVHLEMAIFDTFLTFKSIYLHPWVGFIDSVDLEDYKNLVESTHFRNSMAMCIGLIAFTSEIAEYMQTSLDAAGHKTLVITLPIPMNPRVRFNMEKWMEEPVLKHQSKKNTLLYLNGRGEKKVVDASLATAEPESVIVLTQTSNNLFDLLYYHIARMTPVVLFPSESAKIILGEDYPLFTENLKPYQLREFVTVERVSSALQYLLTKKWVNPEEFLELLGRTKIGQILRNITPMLPKLSEPAASSSQT